MQRVGEETVSDPEQALGKLVAALPAGLPLAIEAPCAATAGLPALERARRAYRALTSLTGA